MPRSYRSGSYGGFRAKFANTPKQELERALKKLEASKSELSNAELELPKRHIDLERAIGEIEKGWVKPEQFGFFKRNFSDEWQRASRDNAALLDKKLRAQEALKSAQANVETSRSSILFFEGIIDASRAEIEKQGRAEDRARAKANSTRLKDEKRQAEHAVAVRATKQDRALAAALRRQMARDHDCPYCGGNLNDQPHLDHIYPIALGGLSVEPNMVFVCSECNLKKRDMTLNQFIDKFDLMRDSVFERLGSLRKRF